MSTTRLAAPRTTSPTRHRVGTPIWLPGEGTATEAVARADLDRVEADADSTHLSLAVAVLDTALRAITATLSADVARQRLLAAQALANDLVRGVHAGESTQSDLQAARVDAEAAQASLADAEAQRLRVRIALSVLTGLEDIPQITGRDIVGASASPAVPGHLADSHPRVVGARRAVEAGLAAWRLTHISDRDSPEVAVIGIHEKQGFSTPYNTRFGLELRIPFATEARNTPSLAAARSTLMAAEANLMQARRQTEIEVGEAEINFAAMRTSAAASARAESQLRKRRIQIERAWHVGEMPLIEVVRAWAADFDAELVRDRSRASFGAAAMRLSLAEGRLP